MMEEVDSLSGVKNKLCILVWPADCVAVETIVSRVTHFKFVHGRQKSSSINIDEDPIETNGVQQQ